LQPCPGGGIECKEQRQPEWVQKAHNTEGYEQGAYSGEAKNSSKKEPKTHARKGYIWNTTPSVTD